MISADTLFTRDDFEYVVSVRRELHRIPEIGFDLPKTTAVVKRELNSMGIPCTEEFGQCSVVGTLNGGCSGKVIGLRADMDALPVEETADVSFRSTHPGIMHACGHDAHTAMLLGAARVLKRVENQLPCGVRLLFQPNEEGAVSGAEMMVKNGAAEDVDYVLGLHVDNAVPSGKIGVYAGPYMAACHPYTVEFFGKSTHATLPHRGCDALAMAVKAYNDIYIMKAREVDPFAKLVLSVSSIQAGHAHNVIADYAKMLISFRYYEEDIHRLVDGRIRQLCANAAEELGGRAAFIDAVSCPAVYNDPKVVEAVKRAAGEGSIVEVSQKLSSEDFSHFLTRKPGAMIRVGTGNEALGCTQAAHNSDFKLDENGLLSGARLLVQFILNGDRI